MVWTLAPDLEGFAGFEGVDVIDYNGTLVTVGGSVFESEARIWTSGDGLAWQVADVGESVPGAHFTSAHVAGDRLIVTGGTQEGTIETGIVTRALIWTAALGE